MNPGITISFFIPLCTDLFWAAAMLASCTHILYRIRLYLAIFKPSLFLFFLRSDVLPADPASACSSFAAKNKGMDQKTKDAVTCPTGAADICLGNQITSPEAETPERKRAKRGGEEEEEEGEIVDSSDEEDEGVAEENPACDVEAADG